MSPKERIEEAHGLWELAVARVAALTEAGLASGVPEWLLKDASKAERVAFLRWQAVERETERPV